MFMFRFSKSLYPLCIVWLSGMHSFYRSVTLISALLTVLQFLHLVAWAFVSLLRSQINLSPLPLSHRKQRHWTRCRNRISAGANAENNWNLGRIPRATVQHSLSVENLIEKTVQKDSDVSVHWIFLLLFKCFSLRMDMRFEASESTLSNHLREQEKGRCCPCSFHCPFHKWTSNRDLWFLLLSRREFLCVLTVARLIIANRIILTSGHPSRVWFTRESRRWLNRVELSVTIATPSNTGWTKITGKIFLS